MNSVHRKKSCEFTLHAKKEKKTRENKKRKKKNKRWIHHLLACKIDFLKASEDLHEAPTRINARRIARILAGGAVHGAISRK